MFYCFGSNDVVEFACPAYTDGMHMVYQLFSGLGVFLCLEATVEKTLFLKLHRHLRACIHEA